MYVDRVTEVKVPVRCEAPVAECEKEGFTYTGSDIAVAGQMIGCIYELKKALQVCR